VIGDRGEREQVRRMAEEASRTEKEDEA